MKRLRASVDALPQSDRDMLLYALDSGTAAHIKLPNNTFVGVNLKTDPQFVILESHRDWSYGIMKKGN